MNKRLAGVLTLAVLILAVTVFWAVRRVFFRPEGPESSVSPTVTTIQTTALPTTDTTSVTSEAPLYIVGAWEGKLAVFVPPDTNPNQVYDVYLSSLPEEERSHLEQGIPIYDDTSLARLLEDYTS